MKHPQASSFVWGPGFEGYLHNLTMSENLRQRFPCHSIDIIFVFTGTPPLFPFYFLSHSLLTRARASALLAGTLGDPANNDLALYNEWVEYEPCPGQASFEEVAVRASLTQSGASLLNSMYVQVSDCHDNQVRALRQLAGACAGRCLTPLAAQPFSPQLQCEVLRGHPGGSIISSRYAFELVDVFHPLPPQVALSLSVCSHYSPCSAARPLHLHAAGLVLAQLSARS